MARHTLIVTTVENADVESWQQFSAVVLMGPIWTRDHQSFADTPEGAIAHLSARLHVSYPLETFRLEMTTYLTNSQRQILRVWCDELEATPRALTPSTEP